jgi:transposase
MAYNFKRYDRDQMYLMPPSVADWLPEDHLAWFVLDAVQQMELSSFYKKYREDGWGGSPYEPSMMVGLLVFAYCEGKRSSRKIEMLCERDVAYKVITANQQPDYSTISRFRQSNGKALKGLFVEVLRLCAESGLVKLGKVSLDGTKIKANASLSSNRTQKHLEEEVNKMLKEAAAKDAEEDAEFGADKRGDELPASLKDRHSRLQRLRECRSRLEKEKEETLSLQRKKIEEREAREKETGKKTRGRKPKPVDQIKQKQSKANITDPDSRIMKTRKGYEQGYNAQVVVTEKQIIIAEDVTQEANDINQLHPMLEQAEGNRKAVALEEEIEALLADAGYCSENNLSKKAPEEPELFIATQKDWRQRKAMQEEPPPRGRIPKSLSQTERMERKLRTKRGREIYKKRSQTVEPVFGQIKTVRGIDQFVRRGLDACQNEWSLICATHNLLKLWRSGKTCWN